MTTAEAPKLLWNPDNVRDVAESLGINLADEPLRILSQDTEYRLGQVTVEALRFMRAANRTTLTVQDMMQALRVLDVEPLYGYESTRPLRFGEASLGPGQPLFYLDDEEVDFEKLINAPLPKVPRDMSFTAHWLAIEGVQPSIPQNPTTAETSSKDLLPKGPGANPALAALAGNDNVSFRPSVKQVISKELILYFDKIQAAVLDDDPDEEKTRLRAAALDSVRSDPGLHQLLPYFVTFITNQVTHHLDDLFVLRQMMELTEAVIQNPNLFLDPYASSLSAPVLTCLLARKLGGNTTSGEDGTDAQQMMDQYRLREMAASLLGTIAKKYSQSNALLRPKLTRTCLKQFLDPTRPPAEAVRVLVLPNLNAFDAAILQPLRQKAAAAGGGGQALLEFEGLVGGIMKAIETLVGGLGLLAATNGVNGVDISREAEQVTQFLGPIIGQRVAQLGSHTLNKAILEVRHLE